MGCCLYKKKKEEEEDFIIPNVKEPGINTCNYLFCDEYDKPNNFFFTPIPENVVVVF